MSLGINRASNRLSFSQRFTTGNPCIFLSHRSLDKNIVREIGNYIMKSGIDIYLDENDFELQSADAEGNDKKITECIKKGIENSTHVLCLLSSTTIESWWVPYEIGFGEAHAGIDICSLKLKPLPETSIPSYLKIRKWLKGILELNNYIKEINQKYNHTIKCFSKIEFGSYKSYSESSILEESLTFHPLKDYLNQ